MDWRQAAAARGLRFTDLAEHVGTLVEGLDLAVPLDDGLRAVLRDGCAERVALLFRDQQHVTPAEYLAFARGFGGHADLHSQRHYCLPAHHEIFVVGNVEQAGTKTGNPRVGMNWHTDHYHLPEPGLFTFLHARQVPSVQGGTRYANGIAAYDTLPAATRARIEGLQVLHSRARLFRALFPEASEADALAESAKVPDVVHPLVRTHPELHRRGLFLGGEWGSAIQGLPDAEGAQLFDELLAHLTQDRFGYSHHWRPGDVLMSDNRCSMHRASEWDQVNERRELHRIILVDTAAPY